jgi:hypothetical protein
MRRISGIVRAWDIISAPHTRLRSGSRDYSLKGRIFPLMTKVMLRRGMFPFIGLASQTQTPWEKTCVLMQFRSARIRLKMST